MRSSTSRTTCQRDRARVLPAVRVLDGVADSSLVTLGVTLNVNVTSGGASGPSQAAAVMSSLSSITTPPPTSIVTVLVTC